MVVGLACKSLGVRDGTDLWWVRQSVWDKLGGGGAGG